MVIPIPNVLAYCKRILDNAYGAIPLNPPVPYTNHPCAVTYFLSNTNQLIQRTVLSPDGLSVNEFTATAALELVGSGGFDLVQFGVNDCK
jgi:hypothetical protein